MALATLTSRLITYSSVRTMCPEAPAPSKMYYRIAPSLDHICRFSARFSSLPEFARRFEPDFLCKFARPSGVIPKYREHIGICHGVGGAKGFQPLAKDTV